MTMSYKKQVLYNKHPWGKPSRFREIFSFLESGVLARKFLFIRTKGREIKPQEISIVRLQRLTGLFHKQAILLPQPAQKAQNSC